MKVCKKFCNNGWSLISKLGTEESKSAILNIPEYIAVVPSTSNALTILFFLIHITSIFSTVLTVASSGIEPLFGPLLGAQSAHGPSGEVDEGPVVTPLYGRLV